MGRLRAGLRAGNVMAALALFAALGGGAYAAASSGSQTITVCVHKKGGGLYRASACTASDSRLSWNTVGPRGPQGRPGKNGQPGANGTTIVARARSSAPVTTSATPQTDALTGNTWTQAAHELDTIVGQATIQEPSGSDCAGNPFSTLTGTLSLDGTPVGSLSAFVAGTSQTTVTTPINMSHPNLFEPGTATQHTLTLQVSDNCTGSVHFVVQSAAIDVEGAR